MNRRATGRGSRAYSASRPRLYLGQEPVLIQPSGPSAELKAEDISKEELELNSKVTALLEYAEQEGVELDSANLDHLSAAKMIPFQGEVSGQLAEQLAEEDLATDC